MDDLNFLLLQKMSEQCVNSFVDSLEDLIENSEMVAPDFTSDEEALSILEKYARTLINGKTGQIYKFCDLYFSSHYSLQVWKSGGEL